MSAADKHLDEFLKKWRKENNTKYAVYSSYHYDAIEAYAKHYHKTQLEKKMPNVIWDYVDWHTENL